MLIEGGVEDSRHAISGQIARELFGGGASEARPSVEGRQPEPAASVVGGGPGRDGPRLGGEDRRRRSAAKIGGEDRRHGPADAARLVSSLQRLGRGRVLSTTGPQARSLACRSSNWPNSHRSSRPGRIARRMGSCAGGGSTSSASSLRGSEGDCWKSCARGRVSIRF